MRRLTPGTLCMIMHASRDGPTSIMRFLTEVLVQLPERANGEALEQQGGMKIATPNSAIPGEGGSLSILEKIRAAGGTLPISRGQIRAQALAALSRTTGNEFVILRDRATGQLFVRELGPSMGEIPPNSRLIIHTQPGEEALAVIPSFNDRQTLRALGQKSSVIINSAGTYSIRFRGMSAGDNPVQQIGS